MIAFGILTFLMVGQAPHDLDCRGRFEVIARIEPTRILIDEEVTLTLRIVALGPWKRGPERPPLAEDPSLLSHFRIRDLPDDSPSRFPDGISGPTGTAWEFSWKLTPLPETHRPTNKDPKARDSNALYPAAIPEIGLILTRDDVPWPRLAREMNWVGPFPLTYRQMEPDTGGQAGPGIGWAVKGISIWIGLTLIWMLLYEALLFKHSCKTLAGFLTSKEPIDPMKARRTLQVFFRERGMVLPAEPGASSVLNAALRAGYPLALATRSADLWSSLDQAAFGPGKSPNGTPRNIGKELATRLLELAGSPDWRIWKRRLTIRTD